MTPLSYYWPPTDPHTCNIPHQEALAWETDYPCPVGAVTFLRYYHAKDASEPPGWLQEANVVLPPPLSTYGPVKNKMYIPAPNILQGGCYFRSHNPLQFFLSEKRLPQICPEKQAVSIKKDCALLRGLYTFGALKKHIGIRNVRGAILRVT